jgi:hypothetical protein
MMFSFRLYFLPVLLFLGTLGCSKPTQEGKKNDSKQEPIPVPVALKSFLPQPPPGWEFQQEPQEETIADAGTRAWASYQPAADSEHGKVIEKVEVILSRFPKDLPTERQKQLRRLPIEGGQFMEAIEVKGFKASASAPIYRQHIVSVFPSPWNVDVVVFGREKGKGNLREAALLFTEKIDFQKLKERK